MPFITPIRRRSPRSDRHPQGRLRRRRPAVPRLEPLEDRTVLSTLTVLNNADSGTGSLRATIAAAHSGDTIVFARSVHEITLTSGELAITKSLNIMGPGPAALTIERSTAPGTPSFRILDISGAGVEVTISGVTIANGRADGTLAPSLLPGLGGGIDNVGSALTLTNDVVRDNQAVGAGGGINNLQGVVTITDSTLEDNQAIGGDGSLFGVGTGGGVNNAQGTVTITGSMLQDNRAIGGDGGDGPFFNGLGAGGAIANNTPSGALTSTLEVVGSTLAGNQAIGGDDDGGDDPGTGAGGAIHNGGTATIIASTFADNLAHGGDGNTASSSLVTGPGGGFGGAILNATGAGIPSTLQITAGVFTGNLAIGGDDNQASPGAVVSTVGIGAGGGIINGGGSSATVSATVLSDNLAERGGGNVPGPGVLVGTGIGGGYVNGFGPSRVAFNACALIGNRAQGGTAADGQGGDGWGGGLVNTTGGTAQFVAGVIAGNQAIGGAGGAGGDGGDGIGGRIIDGTFGDDIPQANPFGPASATLTGSLLLDNLAQGGAGGTGGDGGAGLGGGAFVGPADLLSFTACAVLFNDADGGAGGGSGGPGRGIGGIYNLDHGGFTFDVATVIRQNHASTVDDDIFSA